MLLPHGQGERDVNRIRQEDLKRQEAERKEKQRSQNAKPKLIPKKKKAKR